MKIIAIIPILIILLASGCKTFYQDTSVGTMIRDYSPDGKLIHEEKAWYDGPKDVRAKIPANIIDPSLSGNFMEFESVNSKVIESRGESAAIYGEAWMEGWSKLADVMGAQINQLASTVADMKIALGTLAAETKRLKIEKDVEMEKIWADLEAIKAASHQIEGGEQK